MGRRGVSIFQRAAMAVFVDSVGLYLWKCHRRPDRSFVIRGRQFHVCARCTGLITGCMFAPLLLSFGSSLLILAPLFVSLLAVDGLTQIAGWRSSTNSLRLLTGIGAIAFCSAAAIFVAVQLLGHAIHAN